MALSRETPAPTGATVIGPSILVSGKLSGDEDLTVLGRVEGEIALSRTLLVETSGVVKADVQVKSAVISGVVVGNVTATESVELTREGRMVGDIRSPRVIIVDGAAFRGHVDMGDAQPRPASERPVARAVPAATRPAARPAPAMAPRPPPAPPRPTAKPPPPPPPPARVVAAPTEPKAAPPPPPPPPQPVLVGEGGKKKVLLKKKK